MKSLRPHLWKKLLSACLPLCLLAGCGAAPAGRQTGGDGIGALDPVFLQLPNSGLLIQYTMLFGLNSDGSSSEEAGTAPDVPSPGTEPALVTALRAIEAS